MSSMYTNRQKLAAVLAKWGQPAIQGLVGSKINSLPLIANLEAKIKSTGFVSPMYSLGKDLAPFLTGGISAPLIEPFLIKALEKVPDDAIPSMAHAIVDNALKNGSMTIFEGNIELELEDLQELQKLLRYNLPISGYSQYEVITEEPQTVEQQ